MNPHDVAAMMGLAQAYLMGEKHQDAAEVLAKVTDIDSKNSAAPALLANCYLSLGDMEKAEARAA